jgi:lysophospholipase L1-like esterase
MPTFNQNSKEELQLQSNENWFNFRKTVKPDALIGIAEGDSWFDYPPAWISDEVLRGDPRLGDLINQLNQFSNLNLLRISKAGDTLENMTFGNNPDSEIRFISPQLEETIRLIQHHQPNFFIFSGGGNDIAGTNGVRFEPFLNHNKSSLNHLRDSYFKSVTQESFPEMFIYLIERVKAAKPDIKIFLHGYGHPIPDGRAVLKIFGFDFVGPWFEPALRRKNISQSEGKEIVSKLIDAFNDMLSNLEQAYPGVVYYIDLRPVIDESDWANELHLSALGFKKVAEKINEKINEVFDRNQPLNFENSVPIKKDFNLAN